MTCTDTEKQLIITGTHLQNPSQLDVFSILALTINAQITAVQGLFQFLKENIPDQLETLKASLYDEMNTSYATALDMCFPEYINPDLDSLTLDEAIAAQDAIILQKAKEAQQANPARYKRVRRELKRQRAELAERKQYQTTEGAEKLAS